MAKAQKDYQALSAELDDVLTKLQTPGVHVDQAVKLYETGLGLVQELETHIREAENKIEQLKLAAIQAEG